MKVSTLKGSWDKKRAIAELLKDFSIHKSFKVAGRNRQPLTPALSGPDSIFELPSAALSEIWGPPSSGKTSLMHLLLARATKRQELSAVIDLYDSFDPVSAHGAGIDLEKLLWVRCGARIENALKTADILLQGGGFGLTVLDLGDTNPSAIRKIPKMYWYRFRRAVERTPAAFLIVAPAHITGSCASLVLAANPGHTHWSGSAQCRLFEGLQPSFRVMRSVHSDPETAETDFSVELIHASESLR